MENMVSCLVAFSAVQGFVYEVERARFLRSFIFLVAFYLFLFSFVQGLVLFCRFFSIPFCELPLLAVSLSLVLARELKGVPRFKRTVPELPKFYLFSGLWLGVLWLSFLTDEGAISFTKGAFQIVDGLAWSSFAAILFFIFAQMKERFRLARTPAVLRGLPIYMIAAGILLMVFVFLIKFKNLP